MDKLGKGMVLIPGGTDWDVGDFVPLLRTARSLNL